MFFALVPPPPLAQSLGALARDVARFARGRPVPAENIHLTLAFVDAWPLARLQELLDIGASLRGEAIELSLDTLGGFRRAGVAWIGAVATPPLGALATLLAKALAEAGVALDDRPLAPHVTLARKCRGPYPDERVAPFAWNADSVTLLESQTRAEGARYRSIARWPLAR
ncbi:MAG TPA: RNA 2',3'-cyclic phosphodiesterase [Casimicrobiaceae bacterium]|nr:RNA 2',3'-cyclic phosphodiesterase [Casimicrobiaceae bacterium]